MILWKKYKGITKELIDSVGWELAGDSRSRYSNTFIVMVKFKNSKDPYEPRFANIIAWADKHAYLNANDHVYLNINGMSGLTEVSHYSRINLPK